MVTYFKTTGKVYISTNSVLVLNSWFVREGKQTNLIKQRITPKLEVGMGQASTRASPSLYGVGRISLEAQPEPLFSTWDMGLPWSRKFISGPARHESVNMVWGENSPFSLFFSLKLLTIQKKIT